MITKSEALDFLKFNSINPILEKLEDINTRNYSKTITFSKNAFIPVCNWCRNVCGYCTFRAENFKLLKMDEMKEILTKADAFGCREALFTFGENVDENKKVKEELKKMGYSGILEYLYEISAWCLENTNLLPHTNCGILSYDELKYLREVNA